MIRLPKAEDAGQPRPKSGRQGSKGGQGSNGEPGSLKEEVRAVQKLALNLDYQMREFGAVLYDTWLTEKSTTIVAAMIEAGQTYNTEVQRKKRGHGLGAPFPHVVLAMIEAMIAAAATLKLEATHLAILQDCCSECEKGQLFISEIFGSCKAKVTAQGKSEANGQAILKYSVRPYCQIPKDVVKGATRVPQHGEGFWSCIELRAALKAALAAEGGELQVGPAPRADLARVVQQHVG